MTEEKTQASVQLGSVLRHNILRLTEEDHNSITSKLQKTMLTLLTKYEDS